jgi:hypothetical protein
VEEAVREDLAVVRLHKLASRFLAGRAGRRLADRHALDVLHDEQPRRRVAIVQERHVEPRERREHLAQPLDVLRLDAEVELAAQRAGQVLHHGGHVDDAPEDVAARDLLREQLEQRDVAQDLVARGRPLHLDDHTLAALERAAVHLADRAGRDRHRVDRLEHVLPGNAELLLHHCDDVLLGERWHLVLQRGELLHVGGRQQVGPRREDLAELREGRPELLERLAQVPRAHLVRLVAAALAQAVAGQHGADARRPAEQPGREVFADRHALSAVFTITTVQPAACDTRFGTFPSRNWRRPRMPTLPRTTTSAHCSSIAVRIASAGSSPVATTRRAPGATPAA